MTRISEMNDEQLLALTDDEISKLIDYECALQGVPFLPPHPGTMPVKPDTGKKITCYSINNVIVMDMKQAVKILEAINACELFTTTYQGSDYNNQYLERLTCESYSYPKIETKEYIGAEQWDKVKADMTIYTKNKKQWDEINKAYTDALKERANITEEAYGYISDARNKRDAQDSLRSEFSRYLELAEDNPTVAMNFLVKARPITRDYPQLVEELCPGYVL